MMICVICRDSGKKVWLNTDNIVEIDLIEDAGEDEFARVYFANGHRSFMDVTGSDTMLASVINTGNEKQIQAINEHRKEIGRLIEEIHQLKSEIKRK